MPPLTPHLEPPFHEPPPATNAHGRVELRASPASIRSRRRARERLPKQRSRCSIVLLGSLPRREARSCRREQRQVSVVLFSVSPPYGSRSAIAVAAIRRRWWEDAGEGYSRVRRPIRWSGDEVLLCSWDWASTMPACGGGSGRTASRHRDRAAVSAGVAELVATETSRRSDTSPRAGAPGPRAWAQPGGLNRA